MSKSILRILQISTADMGGGAEKIAYDLFTSYRYLGHQSWLAVGTKKSQDPDVFSISKSQNAFLSDHSVMHQQTPRSQSMWAKK